MPLLTPKRPFKPSRPTKQRLSAFAQLQRKESQEIAQRVQGQSHSDRLEQLLCRLDSNKPGVFASPRCHLLDLEYLAIAQRPDQRYEIIISGSNESLTGIVFETSQYCMEAAAEIEQQFDMSRFLSSPSGETLEIIEAIVQGFQWRETVGRSLNGHA
jgi:hypothetical protein